IRKIGLGGSRRVWAPGRVFFFSDFKNLTLLLPSLSRVDHHHQAATTPRPHPTPATREPLCNNGTMNSTREIVGSATCDVTR
ncbi:hypothetical protein GBA52_006209, partial [Prunus armeniaca]